MAEECEGWRSLSTGEVRARLEQRGVDPWVADVFARRWLEVEEIEQEVEQWLGR